MLALGMGIIAVMFGLSMAEALGSVLLGPIIILIYAGVFGYVIGVIANKVIKFNIPVMEEGNADLSMAGAMALLGWSFAISGTLGYDAILNTVLDTGYIAIIFIAGGLAILHPFNANLGPDEKQDRTLVNASHVQRNCNDHHGNCSLDDAGTCGRTVAACHRLCHMVLLLQDVLPSGQERCISSGRNRTIAANGAMRRSRNGIC